MKYNSTNTQIMWKEIAIILLVMYIARFVIDIYIKTVYNKINNDFYLNKWDGLEEKIRKHLKICNIFSIGPFNQKVCLMYNGLCIALASMALLNDEEAFVNRLWIIKREEAFEMKPFMLALYYLSKQDEVASMKYYNTYLRCNHQNEYIKVIMEYLFDKKKTHPKEDIANAVKTFQNPAIIKLLEDNNILQ